MGDSGDEQDRMVPIANVGRIMKRILPPSAKISKEARQTVQECATEFISFVTGEASDRCRKENRKTVNGDDICWALSSLGFDNYAQAMLRYLCRYREAHDREKPSQVISSPDHDLSNIPMDNNNNNDISAEIVSTSSNNNNSNISPSDSNFMEFKII